MERFETPSVWALLVINLCVFAVWHTAGPEHYDTLRQHLLVSVESVADGRLWTLLTAEFSHVRATHFLANALGLWVFGRPVERAIGSRNLVALYVAGGVGASLAYVGWAAATGSPSASLGASGAVSAIAIPFAVLYPRTVLLVIAVPLPAHLAVAGFVALDLVGLVTDSADTFMFGRGVRIAHSAHLGGAAVGAMLGAWLWRTEFEPPEVSPAPEPDA